MIIGDLTFDVVTSARLTWRIPDFLRLATESGFSVQSPDFPFADGRYGLRLSQTGDFDEIDIELLSLTDPDHGRALLHEVMFKSGTGEEDMWRVIEDNKVEFFFYRDTLERERDLYVPDGTLTLLCSVRTREQSVGGTPNSGGDRTRVIPPHTMTIGELSSETTPSLYVTWTIPRYFRLSRKYTPTLKSHEFHFSRRLHRLQLFPFGNWVRILCDSDAGRYASYELGFKPTSGEEIHIDRLEESHPRCFHILRNQLHLKESECFPDGHLTVFCCVESSEPSSEGSPMFGAAETPRSKDPVPRAAASTKSVGVQTSNEERDEEGFPGNGITHKRTVPDSGSCASNITDKENPRDENVSSIDTKETSNSVSCAVQTEILDSVSCAVQTEVSNSVTDNETLRNEDCSALDPKGLSKLQSDYKQLLLKGVETDASLVVCGKEFRAHQMILRARSTVFDAMFGHDTAERESGRVTIDDLDPDCFDHFLEYLYTGVVGDGLSDDNAFGLYEAADKYDVPTLKAECVAHMRRSLSVDSFCDFLAVALRHPEEELLPQVVTFFKENMARIIVTVKWQQFVIDNGTSANELFIKAIVPPGQ